MYPLCERYKNLWRAVKNILLRIFNIALKNDVPMCIPVSMFRPLGMSKYEFLKNVHIIMSLYTCAFIYKYMIHIKVCIPTPFF